MNDPEDKGKGHLLAVITEMATNVHSSFSTPLGAEAVDWPP